jgi:hypothetical protein
VAECKPSLSILILPRPQNRIWRLAGPHLDYFDFDSLPAIHFELGSLLAFASNPTAYWL